MYNLYKRGGGKLNVLLTGNSYDLAHKLPAKYIDFINVAEELNQL